jgi:PAS domain S-box-containing protein
MGELTRNFDWAETELGSPDEWPQSLRTTVSNLLRSKFPMFLWWGPNMIQFYNDAYRPSLGNEGKHPQALGQHGRECWPEIWDIISPLLNQVQTTGEATWMEDQLVPIFRNGKIEDVYWTYSYSSVLDDEGNHAGILVTCTETTNKVEAFQQLRESEQRFQNLVRDATVGIVVLTGHQMIVELVNEAFGGLINYEPQQLIGKPIFNIIPETKPHFHHIIEKVRVTGQPRYLFDHPYFVKGDENKKEGFLNMVFQPYKEENGIIAGVMILCQDVTEKVLAQKQLEEANERARLSIEAGALGTFEINLISNEIVVSDQFSALFGKPGSDRQPDYLDAFHPDDLKIRKEAHEQAFKSGLLEYEARVIWSDGSIHWIAVRGKVYFDAEQKPVKLIGVAHDITEEKAFAEVLERQVQLRTEELLAAQQSLIHANDYLQNIINKFETALVSLQPVYEGKNIVDFTFKMANAAYTAYSGLTPEAIVGRKLMEVFPQYKETEAFEKYKDTYETGTPNNWELHYNVDGLNVHLILAVSKMNEEIVVNVNDITELKNLQLNLMQKLEELQRSNKNLEEFAHAASHDLKEPIRKIHFFTHQLRDRLATQINESELVLFVRIENATKRMGALIDDLLRYSHISHAPLKKEIVDIRQIIEETKEELELDIKEKSAILNVHNLPTINGYSRQLQQLFQNLISNALKYSKENVAPVIDITSQKIEINNQPYYLIIVKDNGIGFEQEFEHKIFQMFSRLHGKEEYSGTGVGLSIAKKVVENHNGIIKVKSELKEGAAFEIYLPVG